MELISIIVAVYNIESYLPHCFETISKQTYRNLEIILVNDGSTDSSGRLCDECAKTDSRTKVIIHQKNRGLWAARNSGKSIATGNYIMFVDGDDYLHLEAIQVMYNAINSGPRYDMVLIDRKDTDRTDEDIKTVSENPQITELSQEELMNNIIEHEDRAHFVFQWNRLYRADLIKDVWCSNYVKSQDFDFNLRAYLKIDKAVWVHSVLYYYYQREGSLCHNPRAWEWYLKCMTDILYEFYVDLPSSMKKYRHLILSAFYPFMFLLLNSRWKTEDRDEVRNKCLQYERAVRNDFWQDSDFSFRVKMKWTLRVRLTAFPVLFDIVNWFRLLLSISRE